MKLTKPDKFTQIEPSKSMSDIIDTAIAEDNVKLLMKIQEKLQSKKGSYSKALLSKVNNALKEFEV